MGKKSRKNTTVLPRENHGQPFSVQLSQSLSLHMYVFQLKKKSQQCILSLLACQQIHCYAIVLKLQRIYSVKLTYTHDKNIQIVHKGVKCKARLFTGPLSEGARGTTLDIPTEGENIYKYIKCFLTYPNRNILYSLYFFFFFGLNTKSWRFFQTSLCGYILLFLSAASHE